MKVEAYRKGFFDGTLRYEGDRFEVSEEQFSTRWMRKLSRGKPVPNEEEAEKPLGIKAASAERARSIQTDDELAEAVGLKAPKKESK